MHETGLKNCKFFIALFSDASLQHQASLPCDSSDPILAQYEFALQQYEAGAIEIIPVFVGSYNNGAYQRCAPNPLLFANAASSTCHSRTIRQTMKQIFSLEGVAMNPRDEKALATYLMLRLTRVQNMLSSELSLEVYHKESWHACSITQAYDSNRYDIAITDTDITLTNVSRFDLRCPQRFDFTETLHRACSDGNVSEVCRCIHGGADIREAWQRAINRPQNTAVLSVLLYYSRERNFIDMPVPYSDPLVKMSCSPLYVACMSGDLTTVIFLLNHNCDVNHGDHLPVAVKYGHKDIVNSLIRAEANIPNYCARIAAECGFIEILETIARNEGNVNEGNPLYHAVLKGYTEIVRVLVSAECELNNYKNDATALYVATEKGNLEIARMLIDAKCDVNLPGPGGKTPCFVAASNGHLGILSLLITARCSVNTRADNGQTACSAALKHGQEQACLMLIRAGYDVETLVDNTTIAFLALQQGQFKILEAIVRSPTFNPDRQDKHGRTLAYIATVAGSIMALHVINEAIPDYRVRRYVDDRSDLHVVRSDFTPAQAIIAYEQVHRNMTYQARLNILSILERGGGKQVCSTCCWWGKGGVWCCGSFCAVNSSHCCLNIRRGLFIGLSLIFAGPFLCCIHCCQVAANRVGSRVSLCANCQRPKDRHCGTDCLLNSMICGPYRTISEIDDQCSLAPWWLCDSCAFFGARICLKPTVHP